MEIVTTMAKHKRAGVGVMLGTAAAVYFIVNIGLLGHNDADLQFTYTGTEDIQVGSFLSDKDPPDEPYFPPGSLDNRSLSLEKFYDLTKYKDVDRDIDNMQLKPIPFLSSYKNPCWYESLSKEHAYNNPYQKYSKFINEHLFKYMGSLFDKRWSAGQDWRLRCLPYFYIPGVGKCGTTDLFTEIETHPDVAQPPIKEPMYWNRIRLGTPQTKLGKVNRTLIRIRNMPIPRPFRFYVDLFDKAAEEIRTSVRPQTLPSGETKDYHYKITGDASPTYIYDFDGWTKLEINKGLSEPRYTIAELLYQLNPAAKIVFILRDPTERLFSAYKFFGEENRRSLSPEDFHRRATAGIAQMEQCLSKRTVRSCIYDKTLTQQSQPIEIRVGMYQPFLLDWFKVFPRENIFVTRLEDYGKDRRNVLLKLFNFLGIAPVIPDLKKGVKNRSAIPPNLRNGMKDDTRRHIKQFYKKWNDKLAEFLEDKIYKWE